MSLTTTLSNKIWWLDGYVAEAEPLSRPTVAFNCIQWHASRLLLQALSVLQPNRWLTSCYRCHSLNAAFCTNTILAGEQVSSKIETATPKTRMFQNTTDTCHQHNAVVWRSLSRASICKRIPHDDLPPAMKVQGLIVPSQWIICNPPLN